MAIQKITPSLWYAKDAPGAARFYASIFPDSRVVRESPMPADSPSGPAGSVVVVELELFGQQFLLMHAGPMDEFNHAISFTVLCDDQAEVDRYWNALLEGGKTEACGWLRDKYGLAWQITPRVLHEMLASPNREGAKRAAEAMMKMIKLDIATLQAAFDGR